jgi:hypothetical protein
MTTSHDVLLALAARQSAMVGGADWSCAAAIRVSPSDFGPFPPREPTDLPSGATLDGLWLVCGDDGDWELVWRYDLGGGWEIVDADPEPNAEQVLRVLVRGAAAWTGWVAS